MIIGIYVGVISQACLKFCQLGIIQCHEGGLVFPDPTFKVYRIDLKAHDNLFKLYCQHMLIFILTFKFCLDDNLFYIGNHCREYRSVITNAVLTVCSNIHPVCLWSSGLHSSVCTTPPLNVFTMQPESPYVELAVKYNILLTYYCLYWHYVWTEQNLYWQTQTLSWTLDLHRKITSSMHVQYLAHEHHHEACLLLLCWSVYHSLSRNNAVEVHGIGIDEINSIIIIIIVDTKINR